MNIFLLLNRKSIFSFVLIGIFLIIFMAPVIVFALPSDVPDELVPCNTTNNPDPCDFCDLFTLAQNIINFLVFFAVILATLLFVYVGFLYLTAGDNSAQITKAKSILIKVLIGFIVVLGSWLIVDTIMKAFLDTDKVEFGPWNEISC